MFKNLSTPTKSFIFLFCAAVIGTYLTVMLSNDLAAKRSAGGAYQTKYYGKQAGYGIIPAADASERPLPPVTPVDTSSWKTYTDSAYGLSFKYAPEWKISQGKPASDGFTTIEIDPGKKFYNMKIYISSQSYYGLSGLPSVRATIGGQPATDVSNLLYGVSHGGYYFTFDNGLSTAMIDDFNALIKSVEFR